MASSKFVRNNLCILVGRGWIFYQSLGHRRWYRWFDESGTSVSVMSRTERPSQDRRAGVVGIVVIRAFFWCIH